MSIMPRGEALLLPANPIFILLSLLFALAFNMLPLGRTPYMPDLLALTLAFWAVHQHRRVGVGTAFFFGLVMDVHQGSLLGQHALAYTLLAFAAVALHRRLLWFPVFQQAAQVLPLLVGAHLVSLIVRMAAGDLFPGWSYFIAPLVEAALWPVVAAILMAPQRRAPDPDENRPL
jgi:rod shape-determining protein MreD